MKGLFGYSDKLPTFSESFKSSSVGGYSTRGFIEIFECFYFKFKLTKRYRFFLFNMNRIYDYNVEIRARMEKSLQELPFNEEKTMEDSTNLFLILSDIR